MVTIAIAVEPTIRIVKASSPSRAILSSTTKSAKSIQALGPGSTIIVAELPKSVSVFENWIIIGV